MALKGFEPRYNNIIESDPQIVTVPLDTTGFGATKAGLPGNIKNSRTIKHVKGA